MLMVHDFDLPELYFNRELSWLGFNGRVLAQALDTSLPPLERLKFIAIYGTNLDEFYMIRVAGLKSLYKARIQETGSDKMTPGEQLEAIRIHLHEELKVVESCYQDILATLSTHGVCICPYDALDIQQKEAVKEIFFDQIYPVIIPIAVDATHPFPHLNNLSFGLAVTLVDDHNSTKYGLIRIPRILPRFIQIEHTYIPIETIVEEFAKEIFPGFTKLASTPFRVTRNADLAIEEEEADDFMEILEEGLRARNKGSLVRLELLEGADPDLTQFLMRHMKLHEQDIYAYADIPLIMGSFWQIVGDQSLSSLIRPTYSPKILPPLDREDLFDAITKQDLLLFHPYESFEPVVKFIAQASKARDTVAIRMTLYRVGPNSPIVKSLIDAVRDGKQVTVLVELKARFDEENNLHWAKALEDAGAHVVYGIPGLKVHAKIAQVIKRVGTQLKSYLHLATGNYNPSTAKIYTDMSYFTANEGLNSDATRFFHFLTGFSTQTELDHLYMSPTQIKPKLLALIGAEAAHGNEGHIILKSNSLVDPDIVQALYAASCAGCRIDLIIRGICCLRPGIQGVSEHITVHSIIGKYLEHPRIYYFKHDAIQCYLSSADLMPRNLIRRIELMTPIVQRHLAKRIEQILLLQLKDNTLRWILRPNGQYIKVPTSTQTVDNHTLLEEYVTQIYSKAAKETHKPPEEKLAERLMKE
jgi:polyphosphate kinase